MRALLWILALLLAMTCASPAAAQPEPRTLEVPAANSWQHAATGMVLPPRVGGLVRERIRDNGEGEMNVIATYLDRERGLLAQVYMFRTAIPDVALWFDRALATAMPAQGGTLPAITPFARPGASAATGLRAVMTDSVPGMRSTSIAIAPLGSWLVKIRVGSSRLDPAALDEPLDQFIAALRWPAETGTASPAVPIQPCPEPLRLRQARIVRADMGDTLMDALLGVPMERSDDRPPPVYCREPGATAQYGVYRPDASRSSYLIALDDAGIALSLGEATNLSALLGEGRGRRRVSMTLLDRDSTSVLPSFNRLPPPAQAMSVASGHRGSVISVTTDPPRD